MKDILKKIIYYYIFIICITFLITLSFSRVIKKYETTDVTILNNKVLSDSSASFVRRAPVGQIISYMGNSVPRSFLECDGSIYNISDYPYLAEQIKKEFGSYNKFGGNGTTTFAVPDLKGEFLRGRGTNSHANQGSGSASGTHQNATNLPSYSRITSGFNGVRIVTPSAAQGIANYDFIKQGTGHYSNIYHDGGATGSNLTINFSVRPTNTSVLYAIRYE